MRRAVRSASRQCGCDDGEPPGRRSLLVPELRLELAGSGRGLAHPPVDIAEATVELAEVLQDLVIDEVFRARPECPAHGHPLEPHLHGGRAEWTCPRDEDFRWSIGDAPAARKA